MKRFLVLLGLFCAVSLGGCALLLGEPCRDMRFERFASADRVRIKDNRDRTLRETTDSATVRALTRFAIAHGSGWRAPWYGTPVGRVGANFYRGQTFLGDFDLGKEFLVAQGCGYFYTRSVSRKDRATLMALFGVPDPYATGR